MIHTAPPSEESAPHGSPSAPARRAPIDKDARRQQRSAEKRTRILDAAERLFARRGYTKTIVDEIASAAEVSKGVIYLHFASKEALLEAVFAREMSDWRRATVRGASEAGGGTVEMIGTALRVSIAHARANPLLRAILAQDPRLLLPRDEDADASRTRVVDVYRAVLEPLLNRGIEQGELRDDLDVVRTAHAIWLVHDGVIRSLFVEATVQGDEESDALVEASIVLVANGIGALTGGA